MRLIFGQIIFFIGQFLFGGASLRFFALWFLYNRMDLFLKGSLPIVLFGGFLCVAGAVSLFILLTGMVKTTQTIQQTGTVTAAQKDAVLRTYRICVALFFGFYTFGFIGGQVLFMSLDIHSGLLPFSLPRVIIILLQAICFTLIDFLNSANFLNSRMGPIRSVLKIYNIKELSRRKPQSIAQKFFFISLLSLIFMGINLFSASFILQQNDCGSSFANPMKTYLENFAIIFPLSLFFSFGPLLTVIVEIRKRILSTQAVLSQITQRHLLSTRFSLRVGDDVSSIQSSINDLMDYLSSLFQRIIEAIQGLSKVASSLTAENEQTSTALIDLYESFQNIKAIDTTNNALLKESTDFMDRLTLDSQRILEQVTRQSVAVQQSSSSIAEMTSSIQQVSKISGHASTLSRELKETSEIGYNTLITATDTIKEIEKASYQVQEITEVIQSIASQTNLLSMNAAIEAAHAGDFGKGFAIVAEEVRSLAEGSSSSVITIEEQINNMVQKIENGVAAITDAGKSFHAITEKIQKAGDIVQSIALSMEEQLNGATETLTSTTSILDAIQTIKDLADKQFNETKVINDAFKNILDSSNTISSSLEENAVKVDILDSSIQRISDTITQNTENITQMLTELKKFQF